MYLKISMTQNYVSYVHDITMVEKYKCLWVAQFQQYSGVLKNLFAQQN